MKHGTVSVIVPVYNVEKYLGECIDSILCQSYQNLEVIIVDDGSTDGSGNICDGYAASDTRVRVIHKENGGLSDARNCGLDSADGEYVYFCDSDDYIAPNTIEKLTAVLVSEGSDLVFFNALAVGEDSSPLSRNSYGRSHFYPTSSGHEAAFRQLILDEYKPCAYLALFRMSFLAKNDLCFRKGILGEDELFSFYAYMNAEKVSYCADELYYRRIRAGSIMTSTDNRAKKFDSYSKILTEMEGTKSLWIPEKAVAFNEFIGRIAKSLVLAYRLLEKEEKKQYKAEYGEAKKLIRANKSFGDPSLALRLWCMLAGIALSALRKKARMKKYGKQ